MPFARSRENDETDVTCRSHPAASSCHTGPSDLMRAWDASGDGYLTRREWSDSVRAFFGPPASRVQARRRTRRAGRSNEAAGAAGGAGAAGAPLAADRQGGDSPLEMGQGSAIRGSGVTGAAAEGKAAEQEQDDAAAHAAAAEVGPLSEWLWYSELSSVVEQAFLDCSNARISIHTGQRVTMTTLQKCAACRAMRVDTWPHIRKSSFTPIHPSRIHYESTTSPCPPPGCP